MAKDLISFADMMSGLGGIDTMASMVRKAAAPSDKFVGKNTFKARVLRRVGATGMDPKDMQNMTGIEAGNANRLQGGGYLGYYVMILEDSPHSFLPAPSGQGDASTGDIGDNQLLQSMYTTALYSGRPLKPGDEVLIRLEKKDFSYDTDLAYIVDVVGSNTAAARKQQRGATRPSRAYEGSAAQPASIPVPPPTPPVSAPAAVNAPTATNPRLVYFYPGMRYGTQSFVQKKIDSMNIPSDVIIIVGASFATPFSNLQADAEKALAGRTPSDIKLGGWSGGGRGVAAALGSGTAFSTVIYADPEPHTLLGKSHANAKMYYRPENWGSASIRNKLTQLAGEMGPKAQLVTESHDEILVKALKELIS